MDLQKRMQSILVRDYILDSLNRFEVERKAKENPPPVVDKSRRHSTLKTSLVDKKNPEVVIDKDNSFPVIDEVSNSDSESNEERKEIDSENSYESSNDDSSQNSNMDLDETYEIDDEVLAVTPKGKTKIDWNITKESASIEMPEYTSKKEFQKTEIPMKKAIHNKTFSKLQ